jgi:two-component system, cell cycle response regulator
MRILVVDDDPVALEPLVERLRQWAHDVVPFSDAEAAWEELKDGPTPNVVILDWMLPGMSGLDLCRKLRAVPDSPYVYVIVLTGKTAREDLLEGFEAGADDFLTKPFDWEELRARLRAGERIVDLQNELIDAREALRTQAMQDPLTKVLNHGAILEALVREVDRAHREAHPLAVVLADLDSFKAVNDEFGHVAGDRVLIEVCRRMRNCLRSYDSIGRYGGEEFLLVLPSIDEDQAARMAERVRLALSQEPFRVEGAEIAVTLSQGVMVWKHPRPIQPDRLIQAADEALYGVKRSGRNAVRIVRFDGEDPDGSTASVEGVDD